jgi:hypothetical protein
MIVMRAPVLNRKRTQAARADWVLDLLLILVRLAGIEPTTPWFVAKYSIQLSYSRERQDYSRPLGNVKGDRLAPGRMHEASAGGQEVPVQPVIAGSFDVRLVLLASCPSYIAAAKWLPEQWRCGGIRHKVAYELASAARTPSAWHRASVPQKPS